MLFLEICVLIFANNRLFSVVLVAKLFDHSLLYTVEDSVSMPMIMRTTQLNNCLFPSCCPVRVVQIGISKNIIVARTYLNIRDFPLFCLLQSYRLSYLMLQHLVFVSSVFAAKNFVSTTEV